MEEFAAYATQRSTHRCLATWPLPIPVKKRGEDESIMSYNSVEKGLKIIVSL
jgi:hypothetical protein